jgi:AmiR/NasT family two-component response regulator
MTAFLSDNNTHDSLDECQDENQHLRAALDSRPVIDQAKGMLIAEHGCSSEEAFQLLATASQRENRKLRDIAKGMVEGAQAG